MIIPKEANTFNKICSMPRDNVDTGDFSFLVQEDSVSIGWQNDGLHTWIDIPKKNFNKIIKFYLTGKLI